jgi:hypothetical protein
MWGGLLVERTLHSFYVRTFVVLLEDIKQRKEGECKRSQWGMHWSNNFDQHQHHYHNYNDDYNVNGDDDYPPPSGMRARGWVRLLRCGPGELQGEIGFC